MTKYSVKQLSELAGITVRTLHHYDKIGLLKPSFRSEKGYRFYGRDELLRLQQILFYRELQIPLEKIIDILNDPEFDLVNALESHKNELNGEIKRLKTLRKTIDKTIDDLQSKNRIMEDKDMYEGFTKEEVASMRKEVKERWGEKALKDSEQNVQNMGKDGFKAHKEKGDKITQKLADLMPDHDPADQEVQECVAQWHEYLNAFYQVDEERLRNLGQMYVDDERFTAFYERFAKGLAHFLNMAIKVYCDNGMKVK